MYCKGNLVGLDYTDVVSTLIGRRNAVQKGGSKLTYYRRIFYFIIWIVYVYMCVRVRVCVFVTYVIRKVRGGIVQV